MRSPQVLGKSMLWICIMHGVHDLASIDLNLVVALDALLADRHVTRAAHRLGLTQSAASHALARLRDVLGDPLLVRGPGGTMVPTPFAERIQPQLRRALDELSTTLRGETFDPATARHTFHVGASDYVELVMLPRLTERIRRLAPNIDLWVHSYNEHGDAELAAGTLDLVLGPSSATARVRPTPHAAGIYEKVLFDESFTCIVRAKHPIAKSKLTLARYCELTHLLVAPRGTPGSLVDDSLAKAGKTRRIGLAVPHFLVVPYIIASTDLVATLASRVANLFASTLDLATMPPPLAVPKFRMAATWHERSHHDAPHKWLREQLFVVAQEVG
jgi:DNA-binding transcriptional LysR family regulator